MSTGHAIAGSGGVNSTTVDANPLIASSSRDAEGYCGIGGYGVIGDGRSVALVADDGTVDWWAPPRLDAAAAFAALLDPAGGGRIVLAPTQEWTVISRHYVEHTNVLATSYSTVSGRARVIDCLNLGEAGALPWTELARRVQGLEGVVEMTFQVAPGTGLGTWTAWTEDDQRGPIAHAGAVSMGVRTSDDIPVTIAPKVVSAVFTVAAGQTRTVAVVAAHTGPLFLPDITSIDQRLDLTTASWRRWSAGVCWDGPRREQVLRSALALKLLLMTRTGAIAAAATTSLPERVGGEKNWDYRYCWIRDAALTIDALSQCGLQEEVHAAVDWLLRTIRANGPDVHVLYTLDGAIPTHQTCAAVPGYRHSVPVRVGNDASGQTQLGVYGDLFGTVSNWVFGGHLLDVATARQLADLADRCADVWRHDDAGIWELHDNRAYTSSKMNCWRALDRAAALADAGHIAGSAARWRAEADIIRAWIEEHCWSERKQAYTFYAGTEDLDASVLLGASFGFDRGPRMSSTIDAVRGELAAGPLLYRYSGVHAEEETFIACAYWVVEALVRVGRRAEAEQLMTELDPVASPLGLLSEMSTPGTGELVGNIPQALSHLALIKAAATLGG